MMKKLFTIVLMLGVILAADAQKKPKVNQAKSKWEDGNLSEAKSIIDAAIVHEKTKDDGKTWYYRFLIYASMDTSSAIDDPDALQIAIDSYAKFKEIAGDKQEIISDPAGGPLPLSDELVLQKYADYYFNQAGEAYKQDDKAAAANFFEKSGRLNTSDTLAIAYAGYAAFDNDEMDRSISLLNQALERGARDANIYLQLISIYNEQENFEKALAVLKKAREIYPDRQDMARVEVSLLVKLNQAEQALIKTQEAIEKDPSNAALHYTKGLLLEEVDREDEALQAYQDAVAQEADHYESNYNIGVIYLNRANEYLKEKNNLGISQADQKRSKELNPLINERLQAALPTWEKVYALKSEDKATVETLVFIYRYLEMADKAAEFEKKLIQMSE